MTEHDLKSWPEWFEVTVNGGKSFEVRLNDRDYRAGDTLVLREWDPETETYSGREATYSVAYVLYGPTDDDALPRGVMPDYCVMAIVRADDDAR